jgi:putative FmdB family regulatory protein
MPIYEYKCIECDHFFEILVMQNDDCAKVGCPKCESPSSERVLSSTTYAMGNGASDSGKGMSTQSRTCSGGSCTTYDIPGPAS